MITVEYPIALPATFLWTGFVCAISFMEAWLKFRAPGVTRSIGLGIGRLVFRSLNRIEWLLAIAIFVDLSLRNASLLFPHLICLVPLFILFLQTIWLLPKLDKRAQRHIENQAVSPSNLHFYYVGLEIIKVVCLNIFGFNLFKTIIL